MSSYLKKILNKIAETYITFNLGPIFKGTF